MRRYGIHIALVLCGILSLPGIQAQEIDEYRPDSVQLLPEKVILIRDIQLAGNKKTRRNIILRELPFGPGGSYRASALENLMNKARSQLMNTALFYKVELSLVAVDEDQADISIHLVERCYLLPEPIFETVDRTLHEWIEDHDAAISRVNLGLRLNYNNATGRRDLLKFTFITGYTRQFTLNYDRFYIGKDLKWGFSFGFSAGKNREVNYNTINDSQVFLQDGKNFVRHYVNTGIEISYRKAIRTRHSFGIQYLSEQVSDTVVAMNPYYFKSGGNRVRYPNLYYSLTYMNLDFIPYPTRGIGMQFSLNKKGLNSVVHEWSFYGKAIVCWPIHKNLFLRTNFYGTIRLPFHQSYMSRKLLGHGDTFMQGYEYYVIDGVAGGYGKAALVQKLLNFEIRNPIKRYKTYPVPIRVYGKIYGNAGYVYEPHPGQNDLVNTFLYSGGIGLDIIAAYAFTIKLEWTFNHLGQNGLFLHRKSIF